MTLPSVCAVLTGRSIRRSYAEVSLGFACASVPPEADAPTELCRQALLLIPAPALGAIARDAAMIAAEAATVHVICLMPVPLRRNAAPESLSATRHLDGLRDDGT